ncbi:hypothetical protein NQ176_g2205 [Zarea fungicola]|uniref:Uncharacterized protein n=1 Tax=Zarea fungicola TaxID=93591 RepID=A0ACC1NPE9_9HYPO|nr:hypothetical protein NQ176_g2205 [Lecanicillium fungicola]
MAPQDSETISPDFPFEKRTAHVLGSSMAYIDVGVPSNIVTVFLHGNPASSYIWRNIIPYASQHTRCIAPDLIGFGDSDKVAGLEYRVKDHQRFVDAFLDVLLPSQQVVLVLHDWGSVLGLDWARRNASRIAGLVLMEIIIPRDWQEVSDTIRKTLETLRDPQAGRALIIDQNILIEKLLATGVVRDLAEEEMNAYRRPFMDPISREPLYRFRMEMPFGGQPEDVWKKTKDCLEWLISNNTRKLFFWCTPGITLKEVRAKEIIQQLRNTKAVCLGNGLHEVQEDHPHSIGRELSDWLKNVVLF